LNHPISIKGVMLLDDCVVLVKNPRGEWELPGGRAEPGEDHFQALSREIAEELALRISSAELVDSHVFEVVPGRHVSIVTYGCTLDGGFAPRLSNEHVAHCLWPVSGLAELNLPAGYRRSVEAWAMRQRSARTEAPELGLGLIGIGREWGAGDRSVASEAQAEELLQQALALGIRFWDTAASYGESETRLGRFLAALAPASRAGLRIATKFGEHWRGGAAVVDHSYDALCRSVDRSLRLLGPLEVLQIHKCTSAVLASPDLHRAVDYARSLGVRSIGASVSDTAACESAVRMDFIDAIQLPLNARRQEFVAVARTARAGGKFIIANRPVDSGAMLAGASPGERAAILRDCFSFVATQGAAHVILTGTRSASHLRENCEAFALANPSIRARR
jgi:aryl-alcohol dehydrogenase-like predicted oxidoreductase